MNKSKRPNLKHFLKEYDALRAISLEFQWRHFRPYNESGMQLFENVTLIDQLVSAAEFQSCTFRNCSFEGVKLSDCSFGDCEFIDCSFARCDIGFCGFFNAQFTNTQFLGGTLAECVFSDTLFEQTSLINCRDVLEIRFGGCSYSGLSFKNCTIGHLKFENLIEPTSQQLSFAECELSHCVFYWSNLGNTTFTDCLINLCSFNICTISHNTFLSGNATDEQEFNTIDFQTILRSAISAPILQKQFGIHSPDVKNYTMEMVSKVELHTVFISYSFGDNVFAHRLNDALRKRGAFTFLWEKDAPAGQRLKKIMSYNVQRFDKLLFIASVHSLKSEACHFELTNGRKKQDKNWDLVLFPICIDPFLFSVAEVDIPRTNRAEFWTNIEELREINAMDFSPFASNSYDHSAFDQQVERLVAGLRKEK